MSFLVSAGSIKEFFKALLDDALGVRRLNIAAETELYLVNLLSEFVAAEKLFAAEEDGRKETEPLALLYHQAQQQARPEKILTLRRLGDVSLYRTGFFADSLRETVVGPEYYIQMGEAAYGQVAALCAGALVTVYRELCLKFRAVVEVLEEIAARGQVSSGPVGAMKVYESWARTGNGRLEQVLVEAGVLVKKGGLPN